MKKKKSFILITIIIAFFFLLGVVEISFRLKFSDFDDASSFYRSNKKNLLQDVKGSECSWASSLYPHPFYGVIHSKNLKCSQQEANQLGTTGKNFPIKKDKEYFDLLFIGGSVAWNIIQNVPDSKNSSFFKKTLENNYTDKNGRRIRIYSGSVGSWKQPQQMFFYFNNGQVFDGVISLEGANEHSTDHKQSFDVPLQLAFNYMKLPDVDMDFYLVMNNKLEWLRGIFPASFSLAYFQIKMYNQLFLKHNKLTKDSFLYKTFQSTNPTSKSRRKKYSSYLHSICSFAEFYKQECEIFLQPVLEYNKPVHHNEKSYITGNYLLSDFYPGTAKVLAANTKLNVTNLLDLFSDNSNEIYSDYVHFKYNSENVNLGHIEISNAIFKVLLSKWKFKKTK